VIVVTNEKSQEVSTWLNEQYKGLQVKQVVTEPNLSTAEAVLQAKAHIEVCTIPHMDWKLLRTDRAIIDVLSTCGLHG
jgi:hypothetical protein